jgi:flagellar basal body rod protein FlgC
MIFVIGGTRAEFVPPSAPHVIVYDPADRLADNDGLVARPNVDYATEFSNMNQAEQAHKANLKTIATENAMIGALLNEVH